MSKHNHHPQNHDAEIVAPYWKRAHTDWRVQVAVCLMLVAITIYVLSGDLSWQPHFSAEGVQK